MGGLIFLFRTGPPKNQGQPCTPPLELNSTHPPWFIYFHHLSALYLLLSCIVAPSIWAMRIAYESIRALDYPFIQLSDNLQTWSIGAGPCLTFTALLSGAMLHLHIMSQEMYSPPSSTQTLHSVSHKHKHTYMKYSMLCNRKLKYFLKSCLSLTVQMLHKRTSQFGIYLIICPVKSMWSKFHPAANKWSKLMVDLWNYIHALVHSLLFFSWKGQGKT